MDINIEQKKALTSIPQSIERAQKFAENPDSTVDNEKSVVNKLIVDCVLEHRDVTSFRPVSTAEQLKSPWKSNCIVDAIFLQTSRWV
jgi:hypothetical protein